MSDNRSSTPIVPLLSGLILLAGMCFAVGMGVAHYRIFPYPQLQEAVRVAKSLIRHGEIIGDGRRMVPPASAARNLATVHDDQSAIGSGHYAIFGWDSGLGTYSVRLLDAAGGLAHVWPIDEMSFSDKPDHRQNAPHAMLVLEDGSVVVSFDWVGLMARVNACGDALWVREGFYHHSFSRAADGGIWTWYGEKTAYGQLQDIVKFDPDNGEVVTRLSFAKDVITQSPEAALAFSMHPDFPFVADADGPADIFHPNDVEELLPEMADAFAQFDAGDLVLSIRELDMIAVISPNGVIKWIRQGPWLKQHDPDFEPDGRISVYNNSRLRPRSSIMVIDPVTGVVSNATQGLDAPFKSAYRGKHQLLPNGNRLITIPEQGQALEVTPDGTVAVEFNNIADTAPQFNEDLVNARWVPDGFFQQAPACTSQ